MSSAHAQLRLYVAPNGNNNWAGTIISPDGKGNGPKATLEGARDAIRALKLNGTFPASGAIVTVRPGRYSALKTLDFNVGDSGTSGGRIIYRAEQIGTAVIDGGTAITQWLASGQRPAMDKIPPGARGYVQVANLAANGIPETGQMSHLGPNVSDDPQWAELFFDGVRMKLSQWPNQAPAGLIGIGTGDSWNTPTARVDLSTMKTPNYTKSPLNEADPNLDYWIQCTLNHRLFNQFHERVSMMNKATGDVRIEVVQGNVDDPARRVDYDGVSLGRLTLVNSIYELDSPREYYIDRATNLLYFWPPGKMAGKRIMLTMNPDSVVKFNGAKYMDLQGFVIEGGRQDAVSAFGCTSVVVRGCLIRNCGGFGVRVMGGNAVTVRSCEITGVGETGIHLEGGVRSSFTRGNHLADNNYIHHVGQIQPFYRPCIELRGFGLTARSNELAFHSHDAIYFYGNDLLIEKNKVHDVVLDTCDAAAIYAGEHDWTTRGTIIRNNYISNIAVKRAGYHIVHGIYLDDMYSSASVEGNVFRNVEQPIQVGGGHCNKVERNVFVDCYGGIRIDDRGLQAQQTWLDEFFTNALNVPWQSQAWQTRYPEVYDLLTRPDYRTPSGNTIISNVALRSKTNSRIGQVYELWGVNQGANTTILNFDKNLSTFTQQFIDEPNGDFTPSASSQAQINGFLAVRVSDIGVKKDTFIDPSKWGG
ncbi:MAG: right-handed parallel beta-helix repeat-containing protein [Armatimonadetes bacterium]|nr:right-handed parallel beta-helix repeat-containing protein [Armatimonadota bacterium]